MPHSIELNLLQKLRDKTYRRNFFLAETSARIAAQLIALRKRRSLSQKQVAEITGTKQPAISRCEKADYRNWSFNTLRSIADALDARISVLIEPAEDILGEYYEDARGDEASAQPVLIEAQGAFVESPYITCVPIGMGGVVPAKAMPEETKHWIEAAAQYREALEFFIEVVNPPYPQSLALWQEHLKAATERARKALDAYG